MTETFEPERRVTFTPNHPGRREVDRTLEAIAEKASRAKGDDASGHIWLWNEAPQIVATVWQRGDETVVTVYEDKLTLIYSGPKGDQSEPRINLIRAGQLTEFKPTVNSKEYAKVLNSIAVKIGAPGIGPPPRGKNKK